jgi:hypothetical protein
MTVKECGQSGNRLALRLLFLMISGYPYKKGHRMAGSENHELAARSCIAVVLRTAAPLAGLLTLGACAPYTNVETFGPPGKSQVQLDSEANLCDRRTAYSPNHVAAYAQCMHILHNDVRLPDGTIWPGAPQYVYTPQPYTPPPNAPSPYVPEQPPEGHILSRTDPSTIYSVS